MIQMHLECIKCRCFTFLVVFSENWTKLICEECSTKLFLKPQSKLFESLVSKELGGN